MIHDLATACSTEFKLKVQKAIPLLFGRAQKARLRMAIKPVSITGMRIPHDDLPHQSRHLPKRLAGAPAFRLTSSSLKTRL